MKKIYYALLLVYNFFLLKSLWLKTRSKSKLAFLKNSLKGEDVYVVASGPSLAESNISGLKGKNVISLHYSYSAVSDLDLKSHFWVVAAESRMTDFGDVSRKIFNASFWGPGSLKRRNYPFQSFSKNDVIVPPVFLFESLGPRQYRGFLDCQVRSGINKKMSREVPQGMSVIFLGIQVAYFLGAKNIILLGADFGVGDTGFYFNDSVRVVDDAMIHGEDPYVKRYKYYIRPALLWYRNFLSERDVGLYNASVRTRDDVTKRAIL